MDADLLKDVVEFVGLAKEALDEARSKPAFSKKAIDDTVGTLVSAGLVRKSDAGTISTMFEKDPDKALRSLQKVASAFIHQGSTALGKPGEPKPTMVGRRESDQVLFSRFGLS
jgi:hypothetical protein